ncbi:hypothetical protein ACUOCP_57525, partial [Escherichia sp. R-CC3]
ACLIPREQSAHCSASFSVRGWFYLTQQMSDLVDVDWNATISSYIMQQTALQASYKAFTDMQGLSLFQLNK